VPESAARDLVDRILAFGRGQGLCSAGPVSMKGLIAETSSLLHASLPSGIELVICEVPDAAVISGQPGQLQQVILNLCSNAAQAMDQIGIRRNRDGGARHHGSAIAYPW